MADSLRFSASLCFCILFFSLNSYKSCVHGERELANHQNVVNKKKSLMSAPASTTGLHGPSSPLDQKNPPPTSPEILLQDQSRGHSLSSNGDFATGVELLLQEKLSGAGNFVVKVGFGTPKRDLTLMFDTGSVMTWIQCQPCDHCYDQEEPIFDPSKSSTFADPICNTQSTCPPYNITYHDHSYSNGNYAKDTLTLSSTAVIPGFVFGCGKNNNDSNNGESFGKVAGVLGIGAGSTSILSQTLGSFGQAFCYCLPPQGVSNGYLRFGKIAFDTCKPEISIPVFKDSNRPDKYLVRLVGITIGQKRLEMSENSVSGSLANTIIDSGTPISRLPGSVYAELRSTFQDLMSLYPTADPSSQSLLDTCYELSGSNDDINKIVPSMKLHLDGSQDLNLEPSAVVSKERDSQKVCLAFAGNENSDDLTIIGNHQQRNLKISYDLVGFEFGMGKVGFSTGGCGN